jgi:predicted DNA-binding transcriptional regulator AlpA
MGRRKDVPELGYLGITVICKMLGVSYFLFKQLKNEKDFPRPIRFGQRYLWRKKDIDAYIKAKKG